MIENTERVVKRKVQIRKIAIIFRWIGKVFHIANDVVTSVTNGTPDKRWKSIEFCDFEMEMRPESVQRIFCRGLGACTCRQFRDFNLISLGGESAYWVCSQKTVAAYFFTSDHTFEKAGGTAIIKQLECSHRSERVAQESPVDWYEVVFCCELRKLFCVRDMHQRPRVRSCSRKARGSCSGGIRICGLKSGNSAGFIFRREPRCG